MDDHTNDIPALPPWQEHPAVRTQAELERLWRGLMGPLGFSRRTLWMLPLDHDDRPGPLVQIDDLPEAPDDRSFENLADLLRHGALGPGVAFLLTGPGRSPMTEGDLAWARGLSRVAGRAGMTDRPVHRANDTLLEVCSPDALAA